MTDLLAATLAPLPPNSWVRGLVKTWDFPSKTATIDIEGRVVRLPVIRSWTPTPGDVALILQTTDGRSYAMGAVGFTATPPTPVPPPPAPNAGTFTFPALTAGSYEAGVWQTDRQDVAQGDIGTGLLQGAWFYGTSISATMTGATAQKGRVWIDRRPGGDVAAQEIRGYLHNTPEWTSSPPTRALTAVLGTVAVDESGWLDIPLAWAQQLAAGTARGLGIYSATATPYVSLASLAQSGQTGAIQIDWGI